MKFQSKTRFFWLVLFAVILTCALSAGPLAQPASGGEKASIHVASSGALHQVVVEHSAKVAQARVDVTRVLNHPLVREQLKKFGGQPDQLQQKVAVLKDSEILELQSQVMPLAEQMETAAQDGGNRKKILIYVLAGVVAALTIAMFMFYS